MNLSTRYAKLEIIKKYCHLESKGKTLHEIYKLFSRILHIYTILNLLKLQEIFKIFLTRTHLVKVGKNVYEKQHYFIQGLFSPNYNCKYLSFYIFFLMSNILGVLFLTKMGNGPKRNFHQTL